MSERLSRGKAILSIAGIPAAIASTASLASAALAAEAAKPDTAQATKMKATLGYVEKSTVSGANCTNCTFYAATGGGVGSCKLIPGGTVKGAGWCKSYAK
jgi:hypothetical protein